MIPCVKHAPALLVLAAFLLNAALGMRGLWHADRDFFTQHPFSDPLVHCEVFAWTEQGGEVFGLPLPARMYRTVPAPSYTLRFYLELVPHYEAALTQALRRVHPGATVDIDCRPLHMPA